VLYTICLYSREEVIELSALSENQIDENEEENLILSGWKVVL
jgi:hypothetical protein